MSEKWTNLLQLAGVKILQFFRRVARFPADRLTKKLFLAAYEASDDAYWRHHATQFEWRSLDGIIEYSPDLLLVPGEREASIYLIAVRATSNTDLERVAIKLKMKKSGVIHQQEITQNQLYGTPVRKALTAIPLKAQSSNVADWHRLGDVYIRLAEAVDRDGVDLVKGKKIAHIFPSTGTGSVPHRQVERWGQYWDVDQINFEKENIKTRCYRELVQSARQLGRPLTMRRTAYRLLTSQLGLALTFWSQNLLSGEGIRASIAEAEANGRPIRVEMSKTATALGGTAQPDVSTEAGS
jgi:hypothetical protein